MSAHAKPSREGGRRRFSIVEALGPGLPTIEVVDVGAMIERRDRYEDLVDLGLARVTGFEPNPQEHARLVRERRGPYRYLPYCLGTGDRRTFYLTAYPGCSSLYRPDARLIEALLSSGRPGPAASEPSPFEVVGTLEVETRRLDEVDCPGPDLLKVDVQGAELDVLRGGAETLRGALFVECEVEIVPLYEGQPLLCDVQAFLREHGFVLHKLVDVVGVCLEPVLFPGDPAAGVSQALWADAVFVRDFTRLERFAPEELLKAAMIASQVYGSWDFGARFLQAYDRHCGTESWKAYVEALGDGTAWPRLFMNLGLPLSREEEGARK